MYWAAVEPGEDGGEPVDEGWGEQRWTGGDSAVGSFFLKHTLPTRDTCIARVVKRAFKVVFPPSKTIKPAHDAPPALSQKTTTTTTLCEQWLPASFVSTRQPTKHTPGSGEFSIFVLVTAVMALVATEKQIRDFPFYRKEKLVISCFYISDNRRLYGLTLSTKRHPIGDEIFWE